jgi:hypothetical protein
MSAMSGLSMLWPKVRCVVSLLTPMQLVNPWLMVWAGFSEFHLGNANNGQQ